MTQGVIAFTTEKAKPVSLVFHVLKQVSCEYRSSCIWISSALPGLVSEYSGFPSSLSQHI